MREVIGRSQYWGRLKAYVICSFQSKYALALYKGLCLRANLQVSEQEMSVVDFQALLGIPDGKLERYPDLARRVISPAVEEINVLSDFRVEIRPLREGGLQRGKIRAFRVGWHRKEKKEWKACMDELMQPKVGRKARIKGKVETLAT